MASDNEGYWSRSWALLTRDKGWYKPLLVLAAAYMVPIVGPFGASGYALEWGRLTAWGVDSAPKQKDVNISGCIKSGARAFVVSFGYAMVAGLVMATVLAVLGTVVGGLLRAVLTLCVTVLTLIASLRATIYQSIGAGYEVGRIVDMIKRDTEGLFRVLGMTALVTVALGIIASLLFGSVMVVNIGGIIGPMMEISNMSYADEMDVALAVLKWIAGMLPALFVMGYVVNIFMRAGNLLITTAVALWMRQFDVANWGESSDPLPDSAPGQPGSATHGRPAGEYGASAPASEPFEPVMGFGQEPTAAAGYGQAPTPAPEPEPEPRQEPRVIPLPASSEPVESWAEAPAAASEVPTFTLDDAPAAQVTAEPDQTVPVFTLDDMVPAAPATAEPEQTVPVFTLDDMAPVASETASDAAPAQDVPTFTLDDMAPAAPAQEPVAREPLDLFATPAPAPVEHHAPTTPLEVAVAQSQALVNADLLEPVETVVPAVPEQTSDPEPETPASETPELAQAERVTEVISLTGPVPAAEEAPAAPEELPAAAPEPAPEPAPEEGEADPEA